MREKFSVFVSYARADSEDLPPGKRWIDLLLVHLQPLRLEYHLDVWTDTRIEAGEDWQRSIKDALAKARAAVLLIGPNFLAGSFIRDHELPCLLKKAEDDGTVILPIIVRQSIYDVVKFRFPDPVHGPKELSLDSFQAVNSPDQPLSDMDQTRQDLVFVGVARRLIALVEQERARSLAENPGPGTAASGRPHGATVREGWRYGTAAMPLYGREEDSRTLARWAVADRCRLIAITGPGGIGKTALAGRLAEGLRPDSGRPDPSAFERLYFVSLTSAPEVDEVLTDLLTSLSGGAGPLPFDTPGKARRLVELLRERRCLIVLDNAESVLEKNVDGHYRIDREGYGTLLRTVANEDHLGCVVVTTREPLPEITQFATRNGSVRSYPLKGLGFEDARLVALEKADLAGDDPEWVRLCEAYGGNPFAIQLAAPTIRLEAEGKVGDFLDSGRFVVGKIGDLVGSHFDRLDPTARLILMAMAVERGPIGLEGLREALQWHRTAGSDPTDALLSLDDRGLLLRLGGGAFALQPVVLEFVTDRLVREVVREIRDASPGWLDRIPLLKTDGPHAIREAQRRLILKPIADSVGDGPDDTAVLDERTASILDRLRRPGPRPRGYAPGNLVNLLVQAHQGQLSGWDLSRLTIRQADLRNAVLHAARLDGSELEDCTFAETFGSVWMVGFSPDGRHLVASGVTGDARVWDAALGTPLRAMGRHDGWIFALGFDRSGRRLVTAGGDRMIGLWDVATGRRLATFVGHTSRVRAVAFHPDAEWFASGSEDGSIRGWKPGAVGPGEVLYTHDYKVTTLAFDPSGETLASGSADGLVILWDTSSREVRRRFRAHSVEVRSMAFNADGTILATAGNDQDIRLWDPSRDVGPRELRGHRGPVRGVNFGPGNLLASGGDDQTVRVWDAGTCEQLHVLPGHTNLVRTVAFHPDGRTLASGGDDQTIRVWGLDEGGVRHIMRGYSSQVRAVAYHPRDGRLASGHDDTYIRLWDAATGLALYQFKAHDNRIWSLAFDSDGRHLISAGEDATIRVWDLERNECVMILSGHYYRVFGVAAHPVDRRIASAGSDRTVRIWKMDRADPIQTLAGHTGRVMAVAFNPAGDLLASASEDRTVRLWRVGPEPDGVRPGPILEGHRGPATSVAFHPREPLLASADEERTIFLWDPVTGEAVRSFSGHDKQIRSIVFSPDGTLLCSGSEDGTVALWETRTGTLLDRAKGHEDWVESVAFSPDGLQCASASDDQRLVLWDTDARRLRVRHELRGRRPYEQLSISDVTGPSKEILQTLKALGATEGAHPQPR